MTFALSDREQREIDQEIAKYPSGKQQSAIMAALAIVEQDTGWLASEQIEAVANYLDMTPAAAMEVATFYNMYALKPVGRHKLTVCTNLPCALSGGEHIAKYLQEKLGIAFGETTSDNKFTLQEGECMGACGSAPVLLCNNRTMLCHMTEEEIDRFLDQCN